MNRTELKLMAVRVNDLYDEGVIAFYPHWDDSGKRPCVHLTAKAFRELVGTAYVVREREAYSDKEVSFEEDGVKFFTIVDSLEEIWGKIDEEEMLNP